jgi:hypothetical protein
LVETINIGIIKIRSKKSKKEGGEKSENWREKDFGL